MVKTDVIFGKESWGRLLKGMKLVYDAVRCTIGSKGRNVIVRKANGLPLIVNDGVTIAKQINPVDEVGNAGAKLLIEVAYKTNETAGDGTTTSTILGYNMFKKGLIALKRGKNPVILKKEMDKTVGEINEYLTKVSKDLKTSEDIKNIASISANNDEVIGNLIAEGFDKIGKEGVITTENSPTIETYTEIVDGVKLDNGLISPYLITDRTKGKAVLEDCFVLLTDKEIEFGRDVISVLNLIITEGKPLLIIAKDIKGEALDTICTNHTDGRLKCAAIKAPGLGDSMREELEDLATLTGGTVVADDKGNSLDEVTKELLGNVKRVVSGKNFTTITKGSGKPEDISERLEGLRNEMTTSEDKETLRLRMARLSGKVCVLKIGAKTETELKEKELRIEDALNATRAALDDGIVSGGGSALAYISYKLDKSTTGAKIILESIREPMKNIIHNAGEIPIKVMDYFKNYKYGVGYDANTYEYTDMFKRGIIDPTKVVRMAVQNAASIASMLLLTQATIVMEEVKDD